MARNAGTDTGLLEAALIGYQAQVTEITAKIATIQNRLGTHGAGKPTVTSNGARHKKHRISAEGRARIAAAQRKRWAAMKKAKGSE